MKNTKSFLTILAAFLVTGIAVSQTQPVVDDSDLSDMQPTVLVAPDEIKPDAMEKVADLSNKSSVEFQFLYLRNGSYVPISNLKLDTQTSSADGKITLACTAAKNYSIRLETDKFSINSEDGIYLLNFSAECGSGYLVKFDEASANGQAISIFETFERGRSKLEATIGLKFWSNKIRAVWPSDGDYYSWGSVHLTNGHQWDVVAHEMGHAIYDQGNLGQMGGGAHKIDQCYTKALALSEGWASFYGAWLYIDLADTDAKFQYLVPRRAPIRIEHVPDDVCRQITNEWRVTSFFWDVVDANDDGEISNEAFAKTWAALEGSNSSGVDAARSRLESKGFDKATTDRAWLKNF